jgi:hypothetical protein
LGHIPREGGSLKWLGLTIEVIDMGGAHVHKLLATRA